MRRAPSCRISRLQSRLPVRRALSTGPQSVVNGKTVILCETPQRKQIWLVGTAHISKKSAEEVKEVIQAIKPDTVMVELDAARAAKLRGIKSLSSSSTAVSLFDSRAASKFGVFGAMPGFAGILKLFYDYLRALGLDPGLEMRAAMETAESLGIPILLGDQDATITSQNINRAFSFSDILRLASDPTMRSNPHLQRLTKEMSDAIARSGGDPIKTLLSEQFIERLKDRDMIRTHMKALTAVAPALFQALVADRDRYMVSKLNNEPGKRIVGVVGLAHLDGIEDLLLKEAGKPLPKRDFILIA